MSDYSVSSLFSPRQTQPLSGLGMRNKYNPGLDSPVYQGDTISISDEALTLLDGYRSEVSGFSPHEYKGVEAKLAEEETGRVKAPDDAPKGYTPGVLVVGNEEINISEKLQALAAEDFGKFRKIMDKLKSEDVSQVLDGLAELLDMDKSSVQDAIEAMGVDVETFARDLSRFL